MCQVLTGRVYKCKYDDIFFYLTSLLTSFLFLFFIFIFTFICYCNLFIIFFRGLLQGKPCVKGYDSHMSPGELLKT